MRVSIGVVLVLALVAAAILATGRWPGSRTGGLRPAEAGPAGAAELPGRATLGPPGPEAPGQAAPDEATPDKAATDRAAPGRAEGPARLRLACDPSGAGLSATLTVPSLPIPPLPPPLPIPPAPASADAAPGEAAGTAMPTGIMVSGPGGVASVRVAADGAAASDPSGDLSGGLTATVAGARRDEDPLRGIAPGMVQPGARITWTQAIGMRDGPRRGAARLTATFPVSEAEAANLRTALGGCLAPPF